MDSDVGPNAPGSNFSRLERHSADRRIGPASLNHHPNRQRPAVGSRTTAATPPPVRTPGPPLRPRHNEMYTWGRNNRLGCIPQALLCSPRIHFTSLHGMRGPRNAIHRCVEPAHNRVGQGPSHHQLKTVNCIASGSGPTVPTQRAPNQVDIGHSGSHPLDPRRHHRLWNAFAVGKN